jgi:hypothetical protein
VERHLVNLLFLHFILTMFHQVSSPKSISFSHYSVLCNVNLGNTFFLNFAPKVPSPKFISFKEREFYKLWQSKWNSLPRPLEGCVQVGVLTRWIKISMNPTQTPVLLSWSQSVAVCPLQEVCLSVFLFVHFPLPLSHPKIASFTFIVDINYPRPSAPIALLFYGWQCVIGCGRSSHLPTWEREAGCGIQTPPPQTRSLFERKTY